MNERFSVPKDGERKVIDFTERHRDKINKGKRGIMEVFPDGDRLIYPEEKLEITSREAVGIAQEIIARYTKDISPNFPGVIDDFKHTKGNNFKNRRIEVRLIKTSGLIELIQLHKEKPQHFSPEYVYAIAEELVHRLEPSSIR